MRVVLDMDLWIVQHLGDDSGIWYVQEPVTGRTLGGKQILAKGGFKKVIVLRKGEVMKVTREAP